MESPRERPRPLTSPVAVSVAAVALLGVAGASFTTALTRQLRLPRPVNTAKVVVMPPKESPPPGPYGAFAYMAPVTPPLIALHPRAGRRPRSAADEAPPSAPVETATVARAAPLNATDAAAIVPIVPPSVPEPEPTPP